MLNATNYDPDKKTPPAEIPVPDKEPEVIPETPTHEPAPSYPQPERRPEPEPQPPSPPERPLPKG